jgi:hypothetical protein
MILLQSEIDTWKTHPSDSKKDMLTCQRIFLAYNSEAVYYCMCAKTRRKMKRVEFNEWYEQISN